MSRRLSFLILTIALSRTYAQETHPAAIPHGECQRGLQGPLAMAIPEPLAPEVRIPHVTALVLEILKRDSGAAGSYDAMIVINGEIRPFIDATTNYLAVRTNYSTLFDRNDSLDLVEKLQQKLKDLLDELARAQTAPPEFNWFTLKREPRGPTKTAAVVTKIRYLHHALIQASAQLASESTRWPEIFAQSRQLYRGLQQVETFLRGIRENLERAEVEIELRVRLERLMSDVRGQASLIEGVHLQTEQRIRKANFEQDNVRTVLGLKLTNEAVMGDATLDLSPLAPGETPEIAPAPFAPALGSPLDQSIDAIIEVAKKSRASRAMKDILTVFLEANAASMSIDQVIKLATCTWYDNVTNALLIHFVTKLGPFLSQDDVIKLGNAARDDAARKAIIEQMPQPSSERRRGAVVL